MKFFSFLKSSQWLAGFVLVNIIWASPSQAVSFSLGEADINRFVQVAFPYKRSYNGADIYFSDPNVSLNGLDNRVIITTQITAIQNNQLLKATGEISGELKYDPIDYNLHLKQPKVSEFKIIENTMDNSDALIRGVRDVVGQSLPLIVLIDLDQFDFGFGKIQPQSIEIANKRLVITM